MKEAPFPWGLTQREHDVVQSLIKHGCRKRVSSALGIEVKTVDLHLARAREKAQEPNSLMLALSFDRLQRGTA